MLRASLCDMCGSYQWKKVSLTPVALGGLYLGSRDSDRRLDLFSRKEGLCGLDYEYKALSRTVLCVSDSRWVTFGD